MAEMDPLATQHDIAPDFAGELSEAGFEDATEIGRGGFGVVCRCLQRSLDRTVAGKILSADLDPDNLERFLREQRAMGRLSGHPNILDVLEVGATPGGRPYIVTPYHARGSLDTRIRQEGPLAWGEALRLGVKLAGALETAHRLGTLHRDVKPANILLTEYDEPQLADFGIARIAGGFETVAGAVAGSPAFTAPEVLKGLTPTPASDVYSLGATLFCALTGHAAFERRSGEHVVAQFLRITTQPVPDLRPSGIPEDISSAIERSMAENPANRPGSAAEFGHELQAAERHHDLGTATMALPAELRAEQFAEPRQDTANPSHAATATPSGYAPTPPAPSTKFRPPTPTRQLVERPRLIDILRAGGKRRLTVIHAPPGFGKSTLALQWSNVLTEEGVAVAWLAVDRDDNNVVWFLAHLIEAIRRVRPTLAHELGQMLEEHGDEAERYVLTSLINEIHQGGERVAVVIDGWNRVSSTATATAMNFLLENGCHHLRLIVTSRTQSGLPLSRMRVRDELVEIGSRALGFDAAESRAFLVDLGELPLRASEVEELTEATDGWVAALQLASLSLRGRDDPAQLIDHLSGRHHAIGEFLAYNVLNTLEPEVLEFLLATCVTERICGELAGSLADVSRGRAMLEEVEERNLFLHRVDDEGEWFRYQNMFAQFLRRRLEHDHPERMPGLHRKASEWFADHGHLREAVDHALAAGDQQRAVGLVERDGTELVEHSQMASLLGLVDKLPPRLVVVRPRLQIAVAWANVLLQRSVPTITALGLVAATLERGSLSASEMADLRVEAAVVRSVLEVSADRIDSVQQLIEECLSRPDFLRPWVVSMAANVATLVEIYRFDFDAARQRQRWARRYHELTAGPFSVIYGHCLAGIAANEQLDLAAAERHFSKALQVARKSAATQSHAARLASAQLGELLYERGQVTEASRLMDDSFELGAEGGIVDFMLSRYVIGARIKALQGDRAAAAHHLDDGARTAMALSAPRLRARIENERIRLGLPEHPGLQTPTPVEYAARRRPANGLDEVTAQLEEATAIRLLLAGNPPADAELACAWAQEWITGLQGRGRHRALLQAKRLHVACLAAAGRTAEAKQTLAAIAAQCAELGMVRYLLDGGPWVRELVAELRQDQRRGQWQPEWPPVPSSFLDELLAAPQSRAEA